MKSTAPEMAYPNLSNRSVTARTSLSNKPKLHMLYFTKNKVWLNRNTVLKGQKYFCCNGILSQRAQTETQA